MNLPGEQRSDTSRSPRIVIESCTLKHWKHLKPLILDCFDQFEPAYVSYLIRTYGRATRIAFLNSKPAGFQMSYQSADGKHLWLENIGTAKWARKAGVAVALLADLEKIAGDHGYAEVVLAVDEDNIGAINLYERRGYQRQKVAGERRTYAKATDINSSSPRRSHVRFRPPALPLRLFYRLAYPVLTR